MKRISLIISLLTLLSVLSLAQEVFVDSRLHSVYSEDYINELVENYPQKLEYKNWYLDNSYSIMYLDEEKSSTFPYLKHFDPINKTEGSNVDEIDESNFNIYLYQIERKYSKDLYYRIGDTGKVLIVYSNKKITKEFNKYKDEK